MAAEGRRRRPAAARCGALAHCYGDPPTRCSTRRPDALQATAVVVAALQAELDAARAAHAALQLEHSVLEAVAAYQQDSVQALQLAGLAAAADPDAARAAALPVSDGMPTQKERLFAAEEPGVVPGALADATSASALLDHQRMEGEQPAAAVRPLEQRGSGSGSGDASSSSSAIAVSGHSASPGPSNSGGAQQVAPHSSTTRSSSGQASAAPASAGAAAAAAASPAGAAGGDDGANSNDGWLAQLLLHKVRRRWLGGEGPVFNYFQLF